MIKIVAIAGITGWATSAVFMAVTATHPLSMEEKSLLADVAIANNYEMQAAAYAQKADNSEAAQMAAQTVLIDQARLAEELKVAVARRDPKYRWPTGTDYRHRALLRQLQRSQNLPAEFGRQMVISHIDSKSLYLRYLKSDHSDGRVRKIFKTAIPVTEAHLRLVEGLAARSLGAR